MAIFYPDIQVVRNLKVSGNFNTGINEFNTRVKVDQFSYNGILRIHYCLKPETENNTLEFFSRLNSTTINSNIKIPVVRTEGNFAQNKLSYNLKVGKDTDSNRN